nr:hypothetical protein [Legionella jordanis]
MPKIIHNLEEFADKIVSCIYLEGSTLIDIFQQVHKEYTSEDSLIWYWVFSLSRKRGNDLHSAEISLQRFNDPTIRIQEFQKFFSSGKWETTSANTRLFIALINAIPGYDKESEKYLHTVVIPPLKELLLQKMKSTLEKEKANKIIDERVLSSREEELKGFSREMPKDSAGIVLFSNAEACRLHAMNHPEEFAFYVNYLNQAKSKWQISWYDFTGASTNLSIDANLGEYLKAFEIEYKKLSELNAKLQPQESEASNKLFAEVLKKSALANPIKVTCKEAALSLLNKTVVLVNPPSDRKSLVSTYVIKREGKQLELYWYDSLGKAKNLQEYSELLRWIEQQDELSGQSLLRLKIHLMHMSIRGEVEEAKISKIQNLFKKTHGLALITTDDWKTIPPYKLIKDTYILTREPDPQNGEWVLYQRQRGGRNTKVNIKEWPNTDALEQFELILSKNKHLSAGNLSAEVREKLRLCLKNSSVMNEKSICKPINAFSAQEEVELKPFTFVITKEGKGWQLFYIDSLKKRIRVAMHTCPALAKELLQQWEMEPEDLEPEQLAVLSKALIGFKPSAKLNMNEFSQIAEILGKRSQQKKSHTPVAVIEINATNPGEDRVAGKVPGKLDVSQYAVASLFGHKDSKSLEKSVIDETEKPNPN